MYLTSLLFVWIKKRHNVLFFPVDYIGVVGIQVEKLEVIRIKNTEVYYNPKGGVINDVW